MNVAQAMEREILAIVDCVGKKYEGVDKKIEWRRRENVKKCETWRERSGPHVLTYQTLMSLDSGKKQYSNCTELPSLNRLPTSLPMPPFQLLSFHCILGNFVQSQWLDYLEHQSNNYTYEAETNDDEKMIIYGSLKVSSSAEKVNQVWQVGPGVTNDHPMKHGFAKDNLSSFGELKLMNEMSSGASLLVPMPQVANNDKGDWWRVKEINVCIMDLRFTFCYVLLISE
ncbi:hypothetical protein J1N35_021347 [Gossypium stocksii]|uniref:AIR12 DOMON domain-containing protein n=1 Tax=Gossypium stocksii TaxID=47602 RepID=A0A9D3VF27_9ROSI|nr:hypothetical protein J1N35_021347 [Gossypium stocksii]